ncbi:MULTISPECIES: BlaI/MecI/CopY family transcriptional regulator [Glycomyces]|uniref:Transcriptional regulator n=2 Tax=Glycomyces TaxID=58113 RepID=A0A9X3PPA4_9ACTN|nr:BlaI/MecI/CopY family transcriptional regulator [Glycomyces lechevalierae]MDA1387634.1 BlaI/MecI/CopY family transcriptional regulator [Glycomyces lechevalierae]MDR7336599.1 putative transcriptional regulator [Glycomyces lechevalierae]
MRRLGDLEAAVMEVLWSATEPATVRRVLGELGRDPEPAYTTIMTVLDNLHRKGMVTRERDGRAWAYLPAQSREDFAAETMAEVLDAAADRSATLLRFIGRISPEEQARLRELMDRNGGPS